MELRSKEVASHLNNELIPFWDKRAVDQINGGFQTNFDSNGNAIEMPEKYLNTQCRMIWWFSQLTMLHQLGEWQRLLENSSYLKIISWQTKEIQ